MAAGFKQFEEALEDSQRDPGPSAIVDTITSEGSPGTVFHNRDHGNHLNFSKTAENRPAEKFKP
ncbi:MAG: hypothetical protein K0U29_01625 [Gammaproteobacteria bacterium]|nr:hypothetical protein [Gammaproteobacteria bacterium]MCH9743608.1 hypothetical protein [Gammaproteobacteria bacterium]